MPMSLFTHNVPMSYSSSSQPINKNQSPGRPEPSSISHSAQKRSMVPLMVDFIVVIFRDERLIALGKSKQFHWGAFWSLGIKLSWVLPACELLPSVSFWLCLGICKMRGMGKIRFSRMLSVTAKAISFLMLPSHHPSHARPVFWDPTQILLGKDM